MLSVCIGVLPRWLYKKTARCYDWGWIVCLSVYLPCSWRSFGVSNLPVANHAGTIGGCPGCEHCVFPDPKPARAPQFGHCNTMGMHTCFMRTHLLACIDGWMFG